MLGDVTISEPMTCTTPGMTAALSSARASAERRSVLIVGERGTGKETVGRYVHQHSDRAAGPFVPVDCLMLDAATIAAELCGRSRGGSALRDSLGLIRAADGGTLFLDEAAVLDVSAQRLLLRLLRTGTVERVGDQASFAVNVRVIASTTVDVGAWLASGRLLPELHRVWAESLVHVPALRDRSADVPDLARGLLRARAKAIGGGAKLLTDPAADALRHYGWPGNLPELAHLLDAAASRVRGRQIDLHDLPGPVRAAAGRRPSVAKVFVN